jgi:hypothetical protein
VKTAPLTRPTLGARGIREQFRALGSGLGAAFESPWAAYPLVLALQLKVFWGWWAVTDLAAGDTAYYYANAWLWQTAGQGNFVWSPLYTLFYSLFLWVNPDPVWATVAHRIVIVLAVAVLTLAVLRQLLPAAIAWLCAAWWVANPIVFDSLYESHPFALLPTLLALLLLVTARGPWRRVTGFVVLAIGTVLGRSELSVAVGILGLGLLVLEWRRLRRGDGPRFGRTVIAYAVPLGIAGALCWVVFLRSSVQGEELSAEAKFKHTLGMRQMYALGYSQRHPEWKLKPMTQGDGLMTDTFGKRDPTMREMLAANPRAVVEHWSWNLGLLPDGVELLLFDRASGAFHPDFQPGSDPRLNHRWPAFALGGLVLLWLAGLVAVWRGWSERWREWVAPRAAAWVALFGLVCVALPVTLAYRPRPAFMLGCGFALVALTGVCVWVLAARLRVAGVFRVLAPAAAVGLLAAHPTFAEGRTAGIRLTRDSVSRLLPHAEAIRVPGTTVVGSSNAITLYVVPSANIRRSLADRVSAAAPNILQFANLELEWKPGEPLHALLTRIGADYLYVDERLMSQWGQKRAADARPFLEARDAPGWRLIEADEAAGRRWRFYRANH